MCSFLWLSNTPLCICTTAFLSIRLHRGNQNWDMCTPMFIAVLCMISRAWKKQRCFSLTVRQRRVGFPESGLYVRCNNKSGQKQGLKSQKQIQCRVKINPSWIQEEGRGHIPPTAPEQALTPLETRSPHTQYLHLHPVQKRVQQEYPRFWAIMCQVP